MIYSVLSEEAEDITEAEVECGMKEIKNIRSVAQTPTKLRKSVMTTVENLFL